MLFGSCKQKEACFSDSGFLLHLAIAPKLPGMRPLFFHIRIPQHMYIIGPSIVKIRWAARTENQGGMLTIQRNFAKSGICQATLDLAYSTVLQPISTCDDSFERA